MLKKELRIKSKLMRKNLRDKNSFDEKFVQKIISTDVYKNAENILIYYPLSDEIDLLALTEDSSKNFYLPKIDGKNMLCCPYNKGDKLVQSAFKTLEPITEAFDKQNLDLVIVPALCCDVNNYRLGYGGGFYDRFLCDINAYKISCVYKELLFDTIYPDNFDVKMDMVITN